MTEALSTETPTKTPSEVSAALFKDVKYYLIGNISSEIEKLLNAGGGKKDLYMSDVSTHCIADEEDDEVTEAKELFQLNVVKSSWIVKSVECGTLLPTKIFDPDGKYNLFKDVIICPSQVSAKDNKMLWSLVTCYGGQYQTRLTKSVTHLVTTSMKSTKYDTAQNHSDLIRTVTPDWIKECVLHRTRVDESRYHPRLLKAQDVDLQSTASAIADVTIKEEAPAASGPCASKALAPPAPFPAHSDSTKGATARPVTSRQLAQQATALRIKESVIGVNNADMDAEPTQPLQPLPRTPVAPPFAPRPTVVRPVMALSVRHRSPAPKSSAPQLTPPPPKPRQLIRSIPNSAGSENRTPKSSPRSNSTKINQLVPGLAHAPRQMLPSRAVVGMYSPVTGPGRMHLPAEVRMHYGHDPSEHIPEDACLLGCVFYIADYQKYLDAPTIDTWKQVISQYGGQVDESYSNRITHVLCEHQKSDVFQLALRDGKRLVTAHWLNDCLLVRKMRAPFMALHFPFVFGKEKPCANQIICVTNFVDDDRDRVKHMVTLLGAKYTGYMSRANSVLVAKIPGGKKYDKALEWRIPVVNIQWLNDLILGDLNALKLPLQPRYSPTNASQEFNVDVDRVVHLLEGWKIPVKISKEIWKKFQSSQVLRMLPDTHANAYPTSSVPTQANKNCSSAAPLKRQNDPLVDGNPEKRARLSNHDAVESDLAYVRGPVVVFTGLPRNRIDILTKQVERLGGKVTPFVCQYCTHLVTVAILRTVKFLIALNHVRHVVIPDWIEQSARANRFLDESCFAVRDNSTESAFCFKLHESLRRSNQKKVFKDLTFYLTPDVTPSKAILSEMIESAGGKIVKALPPISSILRFINVNGDPTFIIVSCEKDLYLCRELVHKNIAIQSSEFVVTGIMRQEVDYLTHRL